MTKFQLLFVFVTFFAFGAVSAQTDKSVKKFGEEINQEGAISYEDLLEKMAGKEEVEVKVKAKVEAVCQAKGCWMNVVSEEADNPEMFVKFKDYGFFVPLDIAGQEVIMQGIAYKEVTPISELRHYAEDAGKSKEEIEKINKPKEEFKFMASGVIVLPK